MPVPTDLANDFTNAFIKKIYVEKERLAKSLIRKGIDVEKVYLTQRVSFDEETCTMKYELIPMIDGDFYDLSKEEEEN